MSRPCLSDMITRMTLLPIMRELPLDMEERRDMAPMDRLLSKFILHIALQLVNNVEVVCFSSPRRNGLWSRGSSKKILLANSKNLLLNITRTRRTVMDWSLPDLDSGFVSILAIPIVFVVHLSGWLNQLSHSISSHSTLFVSYFSIVIPKPMVIIYPISFINSIPFLTAWRENCSDCSLFTCSLIE